MSKYDKAGLAMIPSGYKDSKVYSLIPNSSNGDFDFTRGSTATRVNKDGLIDTVASGVPRLEYPLIDGVVQDTPSLLLEPSRTNLFEYSNLESGWNLLSGGTINFNQSISPDGTQNASILSGDGVNGNSIYDIISVSVQSYAFSVFAKQKGVSIISLKGFSAGAAGTSKFNLSNGTVDTASTGEFSDEKIENYGNGWYRCTVKVTTTSSGSKLFGFGGENSDSGELFSLYGAQLEQQSYPTSYIPTSGSSVTRAAETCDGAGTSAEFNDSEGVLFAEISALADDGAESAIAIGNGTYDERVIVYTFNNYIYAFVFAGGVNVFSLGTTEYNVKEANKIALKYKSGDYSIYINGIEKNSNTTTTTPSGIDRLNFNDSVSGLHFYGNTKQLITFKEALTDSELEDLTSWDSFNEMATAQEYSIK